MSMRVPAIALAVAVLGAGTMAVLHAEPGHAPVAAVPVAAAQTVALPSQLPPNHPAINTPPAMHAPNEDASVAWTVPAGWKTVPNPNAMRVATYVVKSADGEAEISVSRAGGTPEANIERWVGQFEDAGKETRSEKTTHGIKLSIVEVSGTYRGGMGADSAPRPGWALRGAIAEGAGTPYFFKMIGSKASVRAARVSFDALVSSITPS